MRCSLLVGCGFVKILPKYLAFRERRNALDGLHAVLAETLKVGGNIQ